MLDFLLLLLQNGVKDIDSKLWPVAICGPLHYGYSFFIAYQFLNHDPLTFRLDYL